MRAVRCEFGVFQFALRFFFCDTNQYEYGTTYDPRDPWRSEISNFGHALYFDFANKPLYVKVP